MYNGVLVVDKPVDFTSHDVVAKLRGILRQRRIGHAGTLDPMATGVLVVLLGAATKASEDAAAAQKEYTAALRLGLTTDTQDIWGRPLSETPVPQAVDLEGILPQFRGEILQQPPMYSAVQVKGQRLYKLARKGVEVERPSRAVTIHRLEWTGREAEDYVLDIACSKGTYIRTLCHDIGQALGWGGTMTALRRTRAGEFSLKNALTLEQVEALHRAEGLTEHLHPPQNIYSHLPAVVLTEEGTRRALHGSQLVPQLIGQGELPPLGERCRVYDGGGRFIMTGVMREEQVLFCDKMFAL